MTERAVGFGHYMSTHHYFYVCIPRARKSAVQVFEVFKDGDGRLKIELSRHRWNVIASDLELFFNRQLAKEGKRLSRWHTAGVMVDRLLGKELMVLLWAIEYCEFDEIQTAFFNWRALQPEERWWLYTMTNAASGHAIDTHGWRKALRYALCEI